MQIDRSYFIICKCWKYISFKCNLLWDIIPIAQLLTCFRWFDIIVLLIIIANTVVLALYNPFYPEDSPMIYALNICDYVFTGLYTIEAMIRIIALGMHHRSSWSDEKFRGLISFQDQCQHRTHICAVHGMCLIYLSHLEGAG